MNTDDELTVIPSMYAFIVNFRQSHTRYPRDWVAALAAHALAYVARHDPEALKRVLEPYMKKQRRDS